MRLAGCRTLDEAVARIATFFDERHRDDVRRFQSEALIDDLDVEQLDAELRRHEAEWRRARPRLLAQAREALAAVGPR